jgi:hypothetical protein
MIGQRQTHGRHLASAKCRPRDSGFRALLCAQPHSGLVHRERVTHALMSLRRRRKGSRGPPTLMIGVQQKKAATEEAARV